MAEIVHLVWDLALERPTLGGALVLRQEGELLARLRERAGVTVHLSDHEFDPTVVMRLAEIVFGSSAYPFRVIREPPPDDAWPSAADRQENGFSYFSFSRLLNLWEAHGVAPRLWWSKTCLERARRIRAGYSGRLVCLHLKYVPPYAMEESNAAGVAWRVFLMSHARAGVLDFLLLGDDRLPTEIALGSGVSRGADLGFDLPTQLALVGLADGFLGMASGICTVANFSRVAHVIFKHPAHHAAEMERELGVADRFSFAEPSQQLWRRIATADNLTKALTLVFNE